MDTQCNYIHTSDLSIHRTYLPTYLPTYLHTYIYIRMYTHIYIQYKCTSIHPDVCNYCVSFQHEDVAHSIDNGIHTTIGMICWDMYVCNDWY